MSKSRSRKSAPNSPASSPSTVAWTPRVWRSTLARLTPAELRAFRHAAASDTLELPAPAIAALHGLWAITARDAQLQPDGDWRTWYLRGGRGSGKTRTGAETLADWILAHDAGEWAVIAPTFGDARDVCVEGPSGLLIALGATVENWNRSIGELYVENGAKVYIDGADDGALRIQGKNLRGAWCDEVGLWRNWETAWDESLAFAVRVEPGRVVATGTPKTGHPLVRALLADPEVAKTHMRTLDNADNLHPAAVEYLLKTYAGTRRGRQELEGEFLEDVLGALWQAVVIDRNRVRAAPKLDRVVVGVDPSGAADEDTGANEIGIVAAGFSVHEQHGYVVADRSLRAGPHEWASAVVGCYHDLEADLVVAERNFGGEMVRHTIQSVDRNVPVKLVTSSRGKAIRAEPVAALYEQDRVHHVGTWPELEEQMCLAAGTLVRTRRGEIPIERVRIGDQALTRVGWRSVTWAGLTGFAHCMEIATASGRRLRCTPGHPVWIEGRGFRPAREVQLHECLSRSSENTSSIEGSSTSECATHQARSTGALRGFERTAGSRCSCIECSTRRRTGRSPRVTTSTTATGMGSTTISAIWKRLLVRLTLWRTGLAVLLCSTRQPEVPVAVPRGPDANRDPLSASNAVRSSSARECVPCSAADPVAAVTTPENAATEPVYNLTVDGQPEYFANGLLVHNCHWVPPRPGERTRESPDRMDALVFALTELMVSPGGGRQYASYDGSTEPVVRRGDLVLRGERYVDRK